MRRQFPSPVAFRSVSRESPAFIGSLLLAVLSIAFLVPGCDQGLSPEPPPPYGISGVVTFRNWPPPDSVKQLRLIAFKNYPQNIFAEIFAGNAAISDSLLPYGAAAIPYTLFVSPVPPGYFAYVAVAQQYGPNLFSDWRAVGIYRGPGDSTKPGAVLVPANAVVEGINVAVDFSHPPPPPF